MFRALYERLKPTVGHFPNLLILGVQKAATSSLHNYLVQHPSVSGGAKKEIHFFDVDDTYRLGRKWYQRQFQENNQWILDSTPRYIYVKRAPRRVKKILGDNVKFIVLLREPVSRSFSAWNMYREMASQPEMVERFKSDGKRDRGFRLYESFYKSGDFPTFSQAVDQEMKLIACGDETIIEPSIVRRGFYQEQIEHWLKEYPRKDFLFLDQRSLAGNELPETLAKIAGFLDIDNHWEGVSFERKNKRPYEGNYIDPATTNILEAVFRERNAELEYLTDLKLDWPCLD
jgi:hypothetical protein